jgi:nicotinate-nucleotide adenylyltransferase
MERIGIFGGSFDPVHSGHLRVAAAAMDELQLTGLIVVPAAVSPFKVGAGQGGFDRLLLLRAAFNGVERTVVDDRELLRGGVSYAIDTVREIAAEHPGAKIYFIIGEDSLSGLERWKDIDELRRLCEFKAYPRTEESSTEIRRRLAAGESIARLVPETVESLIRHRVSYNPDDPGLVKNVLEGLRRKRGFCPCRLGADPAYFCVCGEFERQLADPGFSGLCHCRLYFKP